MGGGMYDSMSQAIFGWDATDKVNRFHYDQNNGQAEIDFITSNAGGVTLSFLGWSAEEGYSAGSQAFTMKDRCHKLGSIQEYNGVAAEFKENVVTVTLAGESAKSAERIYKENTPALLRFVSDTVDYNPEYGHDPVDIDDYLPQTLGRKVKRFIKHVVS